MNYITGIKWNGERLRFELWAFELWRNGQMTDAALAAAFESCHAFYNREGVAL